MTPPLPSFASLETALNSRDYSALLLDAYGVFWAGNAQGAFEGAQSTMARIFAQGKKIGIVSNSTQTSQKELSKYAAHGFIQGKHFHFLITSGDLAKDRFSSEQLPFPTPTKRYVLFCPPHPRFAHPSSLFADTPFQETNEVSNADFIYITIPHRDGEDLEEREAFRPMVERFLPSRKPMVCANPDRYAHENSPPRPVVRQGTIASLYEEMGGQVFYCGKPYSPIYSLALDRLNRISPTAKEGVLMVGDTPETDVRGARAFGLHSALITHTGIMAERLAREGTLAFQQLPQTDIPHLLIERFSAHVL